MPNGVDAIHGTRVENSIFPTVTYRAYTQGLSAKPATGERIPARCCTPASATR